MPLKKITKKKVIKPIEEEEIEEEEFEETEDDAETKKEETEETEEVEEIYSYSRLRGDTFLGEVIDAGIETLTSKFTGENRKVYYLSVETDFLNYPLRLRYKLSDRKHSAWGHFLKSLEENCNLRIKSSIKELVGKTFEWERAILEFGQFSSKVVLPIRVVEE